MKTEPASACTCLDIAHHYQKVDFTNNGDILMVCIKCGDAFKVNLTSYTTKENR